MPWNVKKVGNKYAIVKKDTGKIVGHSKTKKMAQASIRARYANMSSKDMEKIISKRK